MVLLSKIEYEPAIKGFKDISPESILKMLYDVRQEIGKLEPSFADIDLLRVVAIVESGKYEINRNILTKIDLSSAKQIVNTYRNNSEGGCESCSNFSIDIINDNRDMFFYCDIKEHYQRTPQECGHNNGFSPELAKYYETPCASWKPKFSPKLEELIR
ncbi:hypothetical protein HYX11_00135 [Candidatus Woesearchaeota archaeon]|nr:hypothetical protein [Candidatus Woesearchaeota archaeon]